MTHIEMTSKVGPDGVLKVDVPVGKAEANREVKITVQSVESVPDRPSTSPEQWRKLIEESAGSISDPTFKRHEQGDYEERGEMFR